jgi:hypothetical protein
MLDKKYWIFGSLAILLIIILYFFFVYKKENYPYNVLKDTIGLASGNNIIENLDQAFAFIGGLCTNSQFPLLVSDCICGQYNNKDKLVLFCNYVYNYHTQNIDKKTYDKQVQNLGENFENFFTLLEVCKKQCTTDMVKRNTYTLFNFDQLLGFLAGTIIAQTKDMMYPCYDLLRYLRYFIYDNPINHILMYVNMDLKIKAKDFTPEQAEDFLKRNNVNPEALQASLKTYCKTYCNGEIC